MHHKVGSNCPGCGQGKVKKFETKKDKTPFYGCTESCGWRDFDLFDPLDGDGDTCPNCNVGTLRTRMKKPEWIKDGEDGRYLRCDLDECGQKFYVRPLEGHGEQCPVCGEGHMVTQRKKKLEPGEDGRFLSCSRYREGCAHSVWPNSKPKVEPLPDEGKDCPACGQGKLVTRRKKNLEPGEDGRFLSCSCYPECKHSEWPRPKVEPVEGDGEQCPACGEGTMVTRVVSKGEHAGKRFLSCSRYPECKHSAWPNSKKKSAGG